jgi:hypothetical protein
MPSAAAQNEVRSMVYKVFDSTGPAKIPSRREVVRLAARGGILTALVVDANVCLDLAGLSRGTLQAGIRRQVQELVSTIAASGADVLPGFGLAELSLDRSSWKLDATKLESVEANITRAIDSAPGRAAQRGSDTRNAEGPVDVDMFLPHTPLLKMFYACLLRAAIISAGGLSRDRALKNLETLLEWMAARLDCVAVLPLQVGVAIFGGDSLARRLVGIGKASPTLSDIWSGAWDMFYIHQLFHRTLYGIDGVPLHPVFVTRDRACYEVFSRSRLKGAIRFDEGHAPLLVGVATDYPHYAGSQEAIARLLKTTMLARIERLVDRKRMNRADLDDTILDLESEWRRFHSATTR